MKRLEMRTRERESSRRGKTLHDPSGHPTYIIAKQATLIKITENMGLSNWAWQGVFGEKFV